MIFTKIKKIIFHLLCVILMISMTNLILSGLMPGVDNRLVYAQKTTDTITSSEDSLTTPDMPSSSGDSLTTPDMPTSSGDLQPTSDTPASSGDSQPIPDTPSSSGDSLSTPDSTTSNGISSTYIIGVKKNLDLDSFIDKKGWGNKRLKKAKTINTLVLKLDSEEFNKLRENPDIEYIEKDFPVKITSIGKIMPDTDNIIKSSQTIPWGISAIGANLSLADKYDGKGIKIAVLDTGVSEHPDLKVKDGISFIDGNVSYVDDNGHGTHVVGTIAALDNKFGVVGVAPKSDIYAVKVLDENGNGTYSQIVEGIEWAIENNINIISMSFGGIEDSKALHDIIIQANQKGILLVAAAGNEGSGDETETYPALYSEVISVGAVTQTNNRASYSSTGSELDIVAPGDNILSTTTGGAFGVLSGTSMAVPHVTGAVAAIWANNTKLFNSEIKDILYQSVTPIGDPHDNGHGLLNLAKALGLVNGPIPPVAGNIPEPPLTPSPYDYNQMEVRISGYNKDCRRSLVQ